jgi:hypothetical protein
MEGCFFFFLFVMLRFAKPHSQTSNCTFDTLGKHWIMCKGCTKVLS